MANTDYNFQYTPLTGRLPGNSFVKQTEQAINELAGIVNEGAAQVEIITNLANQANDNSEVALEKATEALETSSRVYITLPNLDDADDYYDSQLYYFANSHSANLPVEDTGFLEVKTNDTKTAAEQVFTADTTGLMYMRHGVITSEEVGSETVYSVTWRTWSSPLASEDYVQDELTNYLPLSGGNITGDLSVTGTITGNVTGNADTATNATNDANGNPIASTYLPLAGGTLTGAINTANNTWNKLGDDASFGDHNVGGKMCIKTQTSTNTGLAFFNNSDTNVGQIDVDNAFNFSNTIKQSGENVEVVNASGTNYIRYESGVQICWGKTGNLTSTNSDVSTDITFPVAFKDTEYCVSLMSYWVSGGWNNNTIASGGKTTTKITAYLRSVNNSTPYTFYFMWKAIGYWK